MEKRCLKRNFFPFPAPVGEMFTMIYLEGCNHIDSTDFDSLVKSSVVKTHRLPILMMRGDASLRGFETTACVFPPWKCN